ncbi:hypothetical protein V6N13_096797 [Hibiscus sabdariffa]|uniref:Uncharacterized protein n=1 Tax=Hibiscus sabdariffa TaxID=183260 RepID=A0ABR2C8Z2_9ROSI
MHLLQGFTRKLNQSVVMILMLTQILACIIHQSALMCGTALLQGHTGLRPDINAVDPDDASAPPLHCSSDDPELIELFLRRHQIPGLSTSLLIRPHFIGWSTRQSIYMTIVFMCLQDQTELLECVRLLFRATNEVEKEIYLYVKDGKIIQILALLMVAREEVTSPSLFKGLCDPALDGNMSLRQLVLSEIVSLMASRVTLVSTSEEALDELNNKLETMMSMLRLIEVFERAGDKIELHRRYLT